jgi:hypothetical protein
MAVDDPSDDIGEKERTPPAGAALSYRRILVTDGVRRQRLALAI